MFYIHVIQLYICFVFLYLCSIIKGKKILGDKMYLLLEWRCYNMGRGSKVSAIFTLFKVVFLHINISSYSFFICLYILIYLIGRLFYD